LFTKGADAIIKDLLSEVSLASDAYLDSQKHVDSFALTGLRTLFLAYKELDENDWKEWN
jgi:magnesium-transporting ATPase (P-type)